MRESRGGFFQKAPSCASPFGHFLFASFSFVPEHPVNQIPSAVRASFSPRRRTAPLAYKICPRSCYLPEAKNILPTVLRSFSLCEKPNGFGLPGALSKEKEELWNLMAEWEKYLCVRAGGYGIIPCGVGCDNRMNFPTLQNILCLACSPHPLTREPPPDCRAKTPSKNNPSGAVAPAPFTGGSLLVCANIVRGRLQWFRVPGW